MHYVKQFKINGVDTKQVACIELHGKPNAATEGAVGVLGIDVDSPLHDVYKCVAVNGSIYTWDLLSSGLSIMSATISGGGTKSVQFPYTNLLTPATYVVKIGDLILDSEGFLYQINALNVAFCTATYCGTQVVAYGMSAYQLAVKNGFEGDEQEWLASIKGDKGDEGEPGKSAYEHAQEGGYTGTEEEFNTFFKHLVGATGNIQDQLDEKLKAEVGTYTGTGENTLSIVFSNKPTLVLIRGYYYSYSANTSPTEFEFSDFAMISPALERGLVVLDTDRDTWVDDGLFQRAEVSFDDESNTLTLGNPNRDDVHRCMNKSGGVYTYIAIGSGYDTDSSGIPSTAEVVEALTKIVEEQGEQLDTLQEQVDDMGGGSGASITVDDALSEESENPVQNKVIAKKVREMDTAASGLTTRVEALEKSGGGSGGSGGVSSWDDLTDKPFGEENAVIFEGVFQDTQIDADGDGVNDYWANDMALEDTTTATIEIGKTYKVTWEGVEYECKCVAVEDYGGLPFIGNVGALYGSPSSEPFIIARDANDVLGLGRVWMVQLAEFNEDLTTSGRYACKIEFSDVKQIDNKYLAILEYTEGTATETELFPKTTEETVFNSAFNAYAITKFVSVEMAMFWHGYGEEKLEGTVYVDFDGVTYACEPQSVAALDNAIGVGNFTLFGGTGNNEPFAISILVDLGDEVSPGGYLMVGALQDTSPTEHTVRIYQKTERVAGGYKVKHEYPLEQPVSIDMSAFESAGKIVETYADGTQKVTTIEFNAMRNPSKITDSDGNVIRFMW